MSIIAFVARSLSIGREPRPSADSRAAVQPMLACAAVIRVRQSRASVGRTSDFVQSPVMLVDTGLSHFFTRCCAHSEPATPKKKTKSVSSSFAELVSAYVLQLVETNHETLFRLHLQNKR